MNRTHIQLDRCTQCSVVDLCARVYQLMTL